MERSNMHYVKRDSRVVDWKRYYPYITPAEVRCKCGCGIANVSKRFADKLLRARLLSRVPYRFGSFCRCPVHNANEGGRPNSAHVTTETENCEGCDILYRNNSELFIIVKSLIFAGFVRIGINRQEKFIHVDNDDNKPQRVLFNY